MKSIMISIRSEWCEKIARGEKTIEVRKTKPKLQTPFKCYIYCTRNYPVLWKDGEKIYQGDSRFEWLHFTPDMLNGKVIGEFVCDAIVIDRTFGHDPMLYTAACMTPADISAYCVNPEMYGWHISELKIYDKPKDISEFITPSEVGCCNEGNCRGCEYFDRGNGFNIEDDCTADFDTDCFKPLQRAPQSWCYVEPHR